MARGFESKSVADQQEAAFRDKKPAKPARDAVAAAKRRKLELSRANILQQLELASAPAHREMLQKALADVDAALGSLPEAQ